MAVIIKKTGLDQYAPGGNARLRLLVIGGPGVGKTRYSTYWPKPLIMNCEAGLASVADRQVPFADVNTSQDALEVLAMMKQECKKPDHMRAYQTLIVDTLDAFQRKVKDEWLQSNPGVQAFRGYEAWGYLDAKMQMLLTRLLNLDMNVIVNVHYKDKIIKEGSGETATERQELMLQLSGDTKDSVFNDFDLVGWMGSYFEVEDGQRVEKRGLTFKRTPDKPFLKDRLHITPPWMQVRFTDEDYTDLFSALIAKLDDLQDTEVVGEVPALVTDDDRQASAGVVQPGGGGPLPPQDPRDLPLTAMDKPMLQKIARELEIPFKGNTIKSELIAWIEEKRAKIAAEKAAEGSVADAAPPAEAPPADPAPSAPAPAAEEPPAAAKEPAAPATDVEAAPDVEPEPQPEPDLHAPMALDDSIGAASTDVQSASEPEIPEAGATIDEATGEITPAAAPTHDQAVQTVEDVLGGQVVSDTTAADEAPVPAPAPPAPPAPAPAAPNPMAPAPPLDAGRSTVCVKPGCGKVLEKEPKPGLYKIGYIKFRADLCNDDYEDAKNNGLDRETALEWQARATQASA